MTARHAERGQVLPLVALCLAVLMGFAGLAVDVGYWEYQQRQQQSAADAAALGGAQSLIVNGCPNSTAAKNAGALDATSNGYTDNGGSMSVKINNPSTVGPYAGQNCAVSAVITNTNVSRFFTRLVGKNTIPVTTQAVATLVANNSGCIFLLDPSKVLQLNSADINAPTCGILANSSTVQVNASTVDVAGFGYAQGFQSNSSSYPKASPVQIPPVADPCPEIAGCAYLAAHPPVQPNCVSKQISNATATLGPGCYSLLQINNSTVTLLPDGQNDPFIFTGPVQDNNSKVTGNGITMYVTASGGPVQFNGSGDTFSAPTTGNTAGVLFYQVPSNSSVVQFNATSASLSGLVYAPNSLGQINAGGGQYVVLVFGGMQFNASGALDLGGPVAGQSLIKNAVLAQ